VNKTIRGKRHQFSTGCSSLVEAEKVLRDFLKDKQVGSPASANEKVPLPKGLYWKGNVIWLSRMVEGKQK
jgi:hypothetical protein